MLVGDRERIARNLHDDVIQQLFGMGLRLQNLAGLSSDRRVIDSVGELVKNWMPPSVVFEVSSSSWRPRSPSDRATQVVSTRSGARQEPGAACWGDWW